MLYRLPESERVCSGICNLAKVLRTPDGMLMEYREVIRLAERAFGVKISNHRELKRDIFKRTNELVIFLKRLIFLIEQERDKKEA